MCALPWWAVDLVRISPKSTTLGPQLNSRLTHCSEKKLKEAISQRAIPKFLPSKSQIHASAHRRYPQGAIESNLPIPVQTAADTIIRSEQIRKDNSQAMVVELMVYQSSYTVKPPDTKIVFQKAAV